MALLPNLNGKLRAAYLLLGIIGVALGLYYADASWARITWLSAGGILMVFGLVGFCPVLWLFGLRGSSEEE